MEKMVFLADQSPWARGLVRALALKNLNIDFIYCWHDLDAPWVTTGSHKLSITNGFGAYASYASIKSVRVGSWTPQRKPGIQDVRLFNKAKPPSGMAYLTGPKTSYTILGIDGNEEFVNIFKRMLSDELDWYGRVCNVLGLGSNNVEKLKKILEKCRTMWEFIEWVAKAFNIEVHRLSELIRQESVQDIIKKEIPKEGLWIIIEGEGRRFSATEISDVRGEFWYCPKGKWLPLLIERLEYVLGGTAIPYYDAKVKISFSGYKIPGVEFEEYWQKYPTALSILCLGGEYDVTIEWNE